MTMQYVHIVFRSGNRIVVCFTVDEVSALMDAVHEHVTTDDVVRPVPFRIGSSLFIGDPSDVEAVLIVPDAPNVPPPQPISGGSEGGQRARPESPQRRDDVERSRGSF